MIRSEIYGVDFSGSKRAGKKIWFASGIVQQGGLEIQSCRRISELTNGRSDRATCLRALRELIRSRPSSVWGCDFPFGLPQQLIEHERWTDFVLSFPTEYADEEEFSRKCRAISCGKELKRRTDTETATPFSAYNLRLYRQTFFGIRDVLEPLVREDVACVLPMQRADAGKPWILEVCPASTLKDAGINLRYKGKTAPHRAARWELLDWLEHSGVSVTDDAVRSKALEDRDGDALDSIIASFAAWRNLGGLERPNPGGPIAYLREGHVYV